ncbi:hypothetical protein B0H10DRAFT_728196 [Mycena sp. CBHHK59/15]|nr:hypothetical protein B0H10DRAFT_728196 [Mycena sp. CBHHK59/15]
MPTCAVSWPCRIPRLWMMFSYATWAGQRSKLWSGCESMIWGFQILVWRHSLAFLLASSFARRPPEASTKKQAFCFCRAFSSASATVILRFWARVIVGSVDWAGMVL